MESVIEYTHKANEDITFFKKTGQHKTLKKIRELIEAILQDPFEGIGKPEPLKYEMSGTWSRRINKEHRLVYEVSDNKIFIFLTNLH